MFELRLGLAAALSIFLMSAGTAYGAVPESRWHAAQRRLAGEALSGLSVEYLVLPVQVAGHGFDPSERSLITRLVTDRLESATDHLIANPTFVIRYLGTYRSGYTTEQIHELAGHVSAQKIVEIRADYESTGQFDLHVVVQNGPDGSTIRERSWRALEFSDQSPPWVSVLGILDDIATFIIGETVHFEREATRFDLDSLHFPTSLADLKAESAKSPLHAAAYVQLVAMLHPSGDYNEVRRALFERSLVLLSKVPDSQGEKRYFVARAYAYLGRRPAAVGALGKPRAAHERALLAALNGNLPQLREGVRELGITALGFMALRDLLIIEDAYSDVSNHESFDLLVDSNETWAPFIYRAIRDTAPWADYSGVTAKLGLENLVPDESTSLSNWLAKSTITGDTPDEFEVTRLVWRHIEAENARYFAKRARNSGNWIGISELDILDLAKAVTVANVVRAVEVNLFRRGLAERAIADINRFDPLLSGHPELTLQKGRALQQLAKDATRSESRDLRSRAAVEFLNGLAWTGTITRDAAQAARGYNGYLVESKLDGVTNQDRSPSLGSPPPRYSEWPKSDGWFIGILANELDNGILQTCIDYSWTAFYCLQTEIEYRDAGRAEEILARYSDRFIGNPQRAQYDVRRSRASGDVDTEMAQLRAEIDAGSRDWSMYYALGRAHKRRGEYAEARDVFLAYPGFTDPVGGSAVANDTYADNAAAQFYWIGHYEEAAPLLEIAAGSNTGSASNMTSAVRLSLIYGDLESAEAWSAARVRRYDSKYAMRDLLQILHIRGQSEIAWSITDQVQATRTDAQVWSGALVGHRITGASIDDMVTWINASEVRRQAVVKLSQPSQHIRLPQRYLLLAGTMDRRPGPELPAAIAKYRFDRPNTYSRVMVLGPNGPGEPLVAKTHVVVDGQFLHPDELVPTPPDTQEKKPKVEISTRHEMIADAMVGFLSEDYASAFKRFNEAAYYYRLEEYLPYYAFAAALTGKASHLRAALEARETELENIRRNENLGSSRLGYRFDEDLTYAVLSYADGDHGAAIKYLEKALNDRPYLEERSVYPMYQIVELADQMYKRTKVDQYRIFALDLSRRHTIVLPMYSWAYFVVAEYSESEAERIEAAASGLKLDPLSHRGSQLPDGLMERARRHLEEFGPPYLYRKQEPRNVGT